MKNKKSINIGLVAILLIVAVGLIAIILVLNLAKNPTNETSSNVSQLNAIAENNETIIKEQNIEDTQTNNELIVLYKGLDINANLDDLEMSIPFTDENKEKYEITYYNYENGKSYGESKGELVETYQDVSGVQNVKKLAISQDYDPIPRSYKEVDYEDLPDQLRYELSEVANCEIHEIDLDGDGTFEHILIYSDSASPEDYDIDKYTNSSWIILLDENYNKIEELAHSNDQYWELNGEITDEFLLSSKDIEYFDIDNDGKMEILLDLNIYEGIGVGIYKYDDGKIDGPINQEISALP